MKQFKNIYPIKWNIFQEEIEKTQPHIMIISSSWEGFYINGTSINNEKIHEVKRMLEFCREEGIKTIFWHNNLDVNKQEFQNLKNLSTINFTSDLKEITPILKNSKEISTYFFNLPPGENQLLQEKCKLRFKALIEQGISGEKPGHKEEGVTIITSTNRPHFMQNVFDNYKQQIWRKKELIIVLNRDDMKMNQWKKKFKKLSNVSIYRVKEKKHLGACLNYAIIKAKHGYIAKFDDDDYYGPYYLQDLMAAMHNNNIDIVGKKSYYIYLHEKGALTLHFPLKNNKFTRHLAGGSLLFKRKIFEKVKFPNDRRKGSDSEFLRRCRSKGFKIYSADPYNYVLTRRENLEDHTWKISNDKLFQRSKEITYTKDYRPFVTV